MSSGEAEMSFPAQLLRCFCFCCTGRSRGISGFAGSGSNDLQARCPGVAPSMLRWCVAYLPRLSRPKKKNWLLFFANTRLSFITHQREITLLLDAVPGRSGEARRFSNFRYQSHSQPALRRTVGVRTGVAVASARPCRSVRKLPQ